MLSIPIVIPAEAGIQSSLQVDICQNHLDTVLEAMRSDDLPPNCSVNWVAVVPSGSGEDRIVGTVQVVTPPALSEMPTDHPLSRELRLRDNIAELRLMRVAEDMWRQGIGTLVLNTTSPQKPAIGLYHKLGFYEAAPTFIDRYELVWLRLEFVTLGWASGV